MQLSAPALPFDSSSLLPADSAAAAPRNGAADTSAAGAFGALLTAETVAGQTPPPLAPLLVLPPSPLVANLPTFAPVAIAEPADGTGREDDVDPALPTTDDAADLPADSAVPPDALAAWMATSGFAQTPPIVPTPEVTEVEISPLQNPPPADKALTGQPTFLDGSSPDSASAKGQGVSRASLPGIVVFDRNAGPGRKSSPNVSRRAAAPGVEVFGNPATPAAALAGLTFEPYPILNTTPAAVAPAAVAPPALAPATISAVPAAGLLLAKSLPAPLPIPFSPTVSAPTDKSLSPSSTPTLFDQASIPFAPAAAAAWPPAKDSNPSAASLAVPPPAAADQNMLAGQITGALPPTEKNNVTAVAVAATDSLSSDGMLANVVAATPALANPLRSRVPSATVNAAPEKIAAAKGYSTARFEIKNERGLKKTLVTEQEDVTDSSPDLGTIVAKSQLSMPVLDFSPHRPSDTNESLTVSAAPLSFDSLVKDSGMAPTVEFASSAQHAVDSVLATADRLDASGQHGVNLQFSVSGVELSVRVEMRGGNVQTTFRTDSPELRTALAHEWQAVNAAQPADRPQRLAEPVFVSSSGSAASSDSGAGHQRESGAQRGQATTEEFVGRRTTTRRPAFTSSAPISAPPVRSAPASIAGRLHTFA